MHLRWMRSSSTSLLVRVQGVSPFLFTFRLVAFNFASYPVLSMPCGPAWTCSGVVARSSHAQETSPFRVHRTPGMVRFCCSAGPPGPSPCDETPASRRGDFPQCLTLSATLLLPQSCGRIIPEEPTGGIGQPSCTSCSSWFHGGRGAIEGAGRYRCMPIRLEWNDSRPWHRVHSAILDN